MNTYTVIHLPQVLPYFTVFSIQVSKLILRKGYASLLISIFKRDILVLKRHPTDTNTNMKVPLIQQLQVSINTVLDIQKRESSIYGHTCQKLSQ